MPLHVACTVDDANKHEYDINQILFHQGKLYTAADDGKVKVWTPDLKFLQEVQAHPCSIFSITIADDTLYTCSNDGTVKSWDLSTLKDKQILIEEEDGTEFWKIQYDKGVLYIGDDQGNIRIYKSSGFYGSFNTAISVKDLAIRDNLIFASKDNDVIVTDLHLQGKKPRFGIKATIVGRGPLALVDDKSIFFSRDGRDILLHVIEKNDLLRETGKISGAHEMIVNGATAVNWEGTTLLFTAGWDKVVKQWKIENDALQADGSCNVDFVVNTMVEGGKGQIYAAGGDGHVARLDL